VQLGNIAPGAADCVEGAALALPEKLDFADQFLCHGTRLGQRAFDALGEAQAAERQRNPLAEALALDVDEFERASAKVACNAVGIVETLTTPSAEYFASSSPVSTWIS
jgi:hypothetical protein